MSRLANYFRQIFKAVKIFIFNSLYYLGFPFDGELNQPANVAMTTIVRAKKPIWLQGDY
jgi:hypothetical protein